MIYIIGQVRWKPQGISCIVSKCRELWSANRLKWDQTFYPPGPPSVNYALYFIARLHRRRSANVTQPNFAKRWIVNRANSLSWKTLGRAFQKTLDICSIFDDFETTSRLNSEYLLKETRHRQSARALESTRGPLHRLKL